MSFYTFSQNNSGGSFKEPAEWVIVEADNAEQANSIAQQNGIYFDGVQKGTDCKCCGDRWYPVCESEKTKIPQIYGEPVWEANKGFVIIKKDKYKKWVVSNNSINRK